MTDIRTATVNDLAEIHSLIRELAEYERLADHVDATEQRLRDNLFGATPHAEVLMAEQAGEVVGFALFFHNFSTFRGTRGLYLEDLFVREAYRGQGHGKALLKALAEIAVARGCARFEWAVLDWNTSAIDFYRAQGARVVAEWRICRLDGDALRMFAGA